MMGHSHAISGVLGWVALAPVLQSKGIIPHDVAVIAAGAIVTSGAALLPDLDHPSSTIARFLGPISQAVSQGINVIAGGHRQATHSILFCVLMFGGTWAGVNYLGQWAALITVFLMAALAAKGLHLAPKSGAASYLGVTLIAAATTAAAALWGPEDWKWLPWAVALGAFIHLIGDAITPEGVPFFWPAKSRLALPILPSTGGFVELKLLTPLMLLAIAYFTWRNVLAGNMHIIWAGPPG